MVMATGFLRQVQQFYPGAALSVIAKKGIHQLLPFFPATEHRFVFDKEEHKGIRGLWQFGRMIKATADFDLFFSLPDSFSSALMGYATGAKKRVGFQKEGRGFLLTHTFKKPKGVHRVEEYVGLLELFTGQKFSEPQVFLNHSFRKENYIVVNINSEASSRRLTLPKAVEEINALRKATDRHIFLIGAPKERDFVNAVFGQLTVKQGVENKAGTTSLPQLVELLASARLMLTTDSGPAHLANALGTDTVVLFGAGNELNTAPYQKNLSKVIRLNKLSCEPCTKNTCVRYEVPQCLQQLDVAAIVSTVQNRLLHNES